MKMYHEGGREVTEDLVEHVAFGDGGFHVERFDEVRNDSGMYEVLVKWLGLDDEESSWKPATNLLEDVPLIFRRWCEQHKTDKLVGPMMDALGLP